MSASIDPGTHPLAWPIAASMLQIPATTRSGTPTTEASARDWAQLLSPLAAIGFEHVEIATDVIAIGDMPRSRLAELRRTLTDVGLEPVGVCVVRRSVLHPERGPDNLAFTHAVLDGAAALGVGTVCVGLHDTLSSRQHTVPWFWTLPDDPLPQDRSTYLRLVSWLRELGAHAADLGLQIALEMYDVGILSTADSALTLLADVDHPAVGLNPDLGNLIRHQGPIEDWRRTAGLCLPHTTYWHVKNYLRMEDPERGTALTTPSPLLTGFLDYRHLVEQARRSGFRGPIVVEHYGGDGLGVAAANRDYLRGLIGHAAAPTTSSG